MLKKSLFLFALALFMSGCYHAQITTGLEESSEVYQEAWATGFIAGLVPPDIVNAEQHCSNGVAKVETRHSFLNLIAQMITFSIYSPMEITVTCASGMGENIDQSKSIDLVRASTKEVKEKIYTEAVTIAAKTNKPVYINIK